MGGDMSCDQKNPGLVGGFNPFEKYARQIGSFPPSFGVKIPKMFETTI